MNTVVLMGRLIREVELRHTAGNLMAIANFTLAVDKSLSREKKQQFERENKPTADFISVVAWGKTGEMCANYLSKGKRVLVQGSIETSTYQDSKGNKVHKTHVNASNIQVIDWPEKSEQKQQRNTQVFDDDFANDFRAIEDDDGSGIPF